jgi:HEPN domain-containing protein
MGVELYVANLLRVAKQDLAGARSLVRDENRNAIYLCEQAAEKLLIAVLTSEQKHAGIRHQLDQMVDQIPDENPFKPRLRELQDLARYATTYRYPTTAGKVAPQPARAIVQDNIDRVDGLLKEIAARFSVDLNTIDKPAGTVAPIR